MNSDENVERKSPIFLKDIIGVSVKIIERVRRSFCEQGMEIFTLKPRKTRSDKKINGRVEAHLTVLLCQSPPDGKPTWVLKMLSHRLIELNVVGHVSVTMIRRILKKMS